MAVNAHRRTPEGDENPIRIPEFRKLLQENMEALKIDRSMTSRYINDGFSGGEKKRMEMLQMAVLAPQMAILDETDSGLDIDALRIVSDGVNRLLSPDMGVLVITHYARLLAVHQARRGPRARAWAYRRDRRARSGRQTRAQRLRSLRRRGRGGGSPWLTPS